MKFSVFSRLFSKNPPAKKSKQRSLRLSLDKRQKFVIGVIVISGIFFLASFAAAQFGLIATVVLAFLTDIFLLWGVKEEIDKKFPYQSLILPFIFVISIGVFSVLTPYRIITHLLLALLVAIGLYSLFLTENILLVATTRTIPLVNSARIISAIVMLVVCFFLGDAIFSLRAGFIITIPLIFVTTMAVCGHAIWSYSLESRREDIIWVVMLAWCVSGLASILWFWPTSPTITALFLAVMVYFFTGLTHYWFDRRLFKNVLWEYTWIGAMAIFLLIAFTTWHG